MTTTVFSKEVRSAAVILKTSPVDGSKAKNQVAFIDASDEPMILLSSGIARATFET